MNYAELLGPSSRWLPLVDSGVVEINRRANRLVWSQTGQFAAALTPTSGLAEKLASLPLDPALAKSAVAAAKELVGIGPALEKLQLISTIGAVASVANVGISLVGFAVVMHRLSRIEGKLDAMMRTIGEMKAALESMGLEFSALVYARLAAAHANLDRALAASTETERRELARDARRLFQEARLRYLELWKRIDPWHAPSLEVSTALELQARYTAAAIGELQAEFVLGDAGAFRHACRSASADIRKHMAIEPVKSFRCRADAGCLRVGTKGYGPLDQARFVSESLHVLRAQVQLAASTTVETADRLLAFEEDAELPAQLALPPHEILLALKETDAVDVIAVGNLSAA